MSEEKTKPVFTTKAGSVQGAVWEQKSDKGSFLTISTKRTYNKGTTENPEWADTNSLRVGDVSDMQLVLDECYKYCRITSKEKAE